MKRQCAMAASKISSYYLDVKTASKVPKLPLEFKSILKILIVGRETIGIRVVGAPDFGCWLLGSVDI